MGRIENKVALVTGGGSGIGSAIARRLVEEGAKVTFTDVQVEAGQRLAEALGCDFLQQDVTDELQWVEVIQRIENKHGALHILVNNAGITTDKASQQTLLADWRSIQRVNVEGVFSGCLAAIPLMSRSGGGSIVNLSSIASLRSNPDNPAYGASKAAVRHFTKSMAVYCAEQGFKIRCNSVHPGLTMTPLMQRVFERIARARNLSVEAVVQEARAKIPSGEFQQPEDIANAVLFLASDEARQITGAQLVVDGGLTAR